MDFLKRFYNLSNVIQRLSNISFSVEDELSNSLSSLSIQNNLKVENNNEDFIMNFDYINQILFLEPALEEKYKIFFQNHLHMIQEEETIYNNHLSVLITYYNLLIKLLNENDLELFNQNLPFETLNDILKYIETLNENVLFDIEDEMYLDLNIVKKTMISKIEYLVLILIEKLRNYNNNYHLYEYQEISRIFFNTIQLIMYVLINY
jgi:hypothetical protein